MCNKVIVLIEQNNDTLLRGHIIFSRTLLSLLSRYHRFFLVQLHMVFSQVLEKSDLGVSSCYYCG